MEYNGKVGFLWQNLSGKNLQKNFRGALFMYLYAKVLLYVYPHLDALIESMDEHILKKALNSFKDYSPAISQAEKVIDFMMQKQVFLNLKGILDGALQKFSSEDLIYFEYKYFKRKKPEFFVGFDFASRAYFRKQNKLIERFCELLNRAGLTKEWYDENCADINFIREVSKKALQIEQVSFKNKPKKTREQNAKKAV